MANINKKTKKLAVSAMLSALSVVILYLGSVFNVFDLTSVAVVALLMVFAVDEIGSPYTLVIYTVVGILSLLLLPDKFAAVSFILIGGNYPILREKISKLPAIPSWIIKLIYFNLILTALIAVSLFILNIEDEDLGYNILTYLLGNATFICFELAVATVSKLYRNNLRKRFKIDKIFN